MASFQYEPPLGKSDAGILQIVRLVDGGQILGIARWSSAIDEDEGIVQLIDFQIEPSHGRRGYGKQLLGEMIEQCLAYHRARKQPLRRIWLPLHQKRHVIARAFFLSQGFTHTTTIRDLAKDQDLLVYVRTFD